jgi:hypothetical protein
LKETEREKGETNGVSVSVDIMTISLSAEATFFHKEKENEEEICQDIAVINIYVNGFNLCTIGNT